MRSVWRRYLEEAEGLVFVVDAADASRFHEAREALESVLEAPELAPSAPLLVLANKSDRTEAHSSAAIRRLVVDPALHAVFPSSAPSSASAPVVGGGAVIGGGSASSTAGSSGGTDTSKKSILPETTTATGRHVSVQSISGLSGDGIVPAFTWAVEQTLSTLPDRSTNK